MAAGSANNVTAPLKLRQEDSGDYILHTDSGGFSGEAVARLRGLLPAAI